TPCKATEKKRILLMQLKSIGPAISSVMSREVYLYEHPACQVPRPFFFSLFLPAPFLLFDRAAGFLPPRPHIVAGRRAQMLSRLAASSAATTLQGPGLYSNRARRQGLIGRGDYAPVCYLSVLSVSAHYSDDGCCFWQALLRSPRRVR